MITVNAVTSLPTGINEIKNANSFSVYPNPTSGSWQLTVSNELIGAELEICDEQGRLVFKSAISNQQSAIQLEAASGVYYLRISNESVSLMKKLVKM